ncbi:pyruvate dehydrogenase (acetyl-transferring), homodimeric type [Pseudokineococcus sp. 1T1Z-3]|uniref:pyruvate dehydrogenase (acetyl-transferring), homodimeric type n=1 Tax=Pseudokineococcus sp. 1T1Z-3 TaxID=3132745 RepID=UPI00309F7AB9
MPSQVPDIDPEETQEWLDSLDGAVDERGRTRARYLMLSTLQRARERGVGVPNPVTSDYVNTIGPEQEPWFPGDEEVERRYRAWLRWNAAVQVHRAQRPDVAVGGHISSYASSATLYEVGFNHFFKGHENGTPDQVYIQGHASPGVYARAFLEGRLSETDMDGFRQELTAKGRGLPSYPHPRLMRDFWEFPTVSMGLGPMNAIYQAQSNKYLTARGIKDVSASHVWAFLGDGEMDEPESRGLLQVAANENLDNLTFVVNCNLQRLDGPVRGNGKIVQELESFFRGAGWNVIKVLWGREWDPLLAADAGGALVNVMNQTLDGDYQTFKAESGGYIREHFFGQDPRTRKLVEDYTDDQLWGLKRGGHDYRKVFAAYKAAVEHTGQPTVVLAKTVKGYGLGSHFEGRNATHQMKKLTLEDLKAFRDSLRIPITDERLEENLYNPPYYHPGEDAEEIRYLKERRQKLGGPLPARRTTPHTKIEMPGDDAYKVLKRGSGKQTIATTMAFVRLLKDLMRDKELGRRVVPIIPDEARTFGMDSFFPTAKIYNPNGQKYQSVDRELMLAYKESETGQILHVGINEGGSMGAFTAAGSAYATHGEALIPVYVFYSMFGFQRTGDSMWAAADQMARGFLLGATAGRTTLTGEGLQHADGHSPLLASTNPAVVSYDPAYGYEIGHVVRAGLERMYGEGPKGTDAAGHDVDPNVMYYITVYNEPMVQPAEPDDVDVEGIVRGIHLVSRGHEGDRPRVQLLASGVGVPWALEAQELLGNEFGVDADVWSVTSWGELRRDGLACDQWVYDNPGASADEAPVPYLTKKLRGFEGPVVAVSDYMKSVQEQIRPWVDGDYTVLGTDGFGLSDTRPAVRRHFHVDGPSMAYQALVRLAARGEVDADVPAKAYSTWQLDDPRAGTSGSAGGDA